MRIVEKCVTSARPETVWRVLADVEHWHTWNPTILNVKPLRDTGLNVGTLYRVSQLRLPPAVYEVIECIPGQAFTWVQKLPGGAMIADHRLASRSWGTQVDLSVTSKGPLAHVLAKLFSKTIRDYVATEAKSLKSYCERQTA